MSKLISKFGIIRSYNHTNLLSRQKLLQRIPSYSPDMHIRIFQHLRHFLGSKTLTANIKSLMRVESCTGIKMVKYIEPNCKKYISIKYLFLTRKSSSTKIEI